MFQASAWNIMFFFFIIVLSSNSKMSRNYKFRNQNSIYFITYSTVYWIDLFTRNEYKDVIINSWKYCQREKGLEIYAWVIMSNHIHMIIGSNKNNLEDIVRDFKSYTSTSLKRLILDNPFESRKEWMLKLMIQAGTKNPNNNKFQLWQQHNHPIELSSNFLIDQKPDYIHNNPVKVGFVTEPQHYLFSSAKDYYGEQGLIDIILIN